MAKGDIHTVKRDDHWVNEVEGGQRASNSAPIKSDAQAKGREMAIERGVEHLIHKENGQIGERNTYHAAATLAARRGSAPAAT